MEITKAEYLERVDMVARELLEESRDATSEDDRRERVYDAAHERAQAVYWYGCTHSELQVCTHSTNGDYYFTEFGEVTVKSLSEVISNCAFYAFNQDVLEKVSELEDEYPLTDDSEDHDSDDSEDESSDGSVGAPHDQATLDHLSHELAQIRNRSMVVFRDGSGSSASDAFIAIDSSVRLRMETVAIRGYGCDVHMSTADRESWSNLARNYDSVFADMRQRASAGNDPVTE